MTKRRSTKGALLMSVLSLFLCFSMLLGTTFAWFTDEVTSGKNVIKTGNLDVNLYHTVDGADVAVNSGTELFNDVTLWEPGAMVWEKFTVANEGNLALKYQFTLNALNATVIDGVSFASMLKVAIVDDTFTYDRASVEAIPAEKWQSLETFTLSEKLEDGEKDIYGIIIWWQPTNDDNRFNVKENVSVEVSVNLIATQVPAADEFDGFGTDYDEDAWVEGWQVYNAQDLQAAINNGKTNITLEDDIVLDEPIVIPAAPTTYSLRNATPAVVIDLNGKNITTAYNETTGKHAYAIDNYGSLVINGGTIEARGIYNRDGATMTVNGTKIVNLDMNGGSCIWSYGGEVYINDATLIGYTGCVYSEGYLEINGGTYTCYGGVTDDGVQVGPTYNIRSTGELVINGGEFTSRHGLLAIKGSAEINGGTYTMTSIGVITSHVFYVYGDSSNVVVNGGTFNCDLRTAQNNGSSMICVDAANVAVNVYGGTFNLTPAKYVADGFKAVANNGKYVVVSDSISDENVIGTPDELASALTGAAAAGSGDNTIYMAGDLDLTGTTWTPIKVDGYQGAGVVTIEGNGATITGLTAPLFAGGFAGKSGIIIRNLTIADSNIVSTSGLGGGAFIDSADSMHVITLENCHLVNSTVSGERTGGLIGWCSGYAKLNDGPVKAYITITNCSVVDSKVIGAGSAGAIAGHPGASDYTYTTIEKCLVKNVEVVSNDTGSWRTGAVVGTANNGHVVINNVTVEDVTLTQNGVTAESNLLFGRFVPSGTGTLVIDGVSVVADNDALKNAVANGGNYVLASNIVLEETIVIPSGAKVVINLNGCTITYNSTTQGEAMITNKGNLTINDTVGTGVINYNYTGAADPSYGKGNYTISNQGTLTVNGGKITIANLSAHAKYPIDNNSTTGDAVLVINGGHLYNYNTSAIRQFCNSTTYKNSVTINGGLVEGYCAVWMQNPGKNTVNCSLTITGGEIRTTAKAYVAGTATLSEVSSSIYCTISGNGGAWSADSFVSITGGTFNENVKLNVDAPTVTIGDNATFNGVIAK